MAAGLGAIHTRAWVAVAGVRGPGRDEVGLRVATGQGEVMARAERPTQGCG